MTQKPTFAPGDVVSLHNSQERLTVIECDGVKTKVVWFCGEDFCEETYGSEEITLAPDTPIH